MYIITLREEAKKDDSNGLVSWLNMKKAVLNDVTFRWLAAILAA